MEERKGRRKTERGMEVWIVTNTKGEVMDKFRSKFNAIKFIKKRGGLEEYNLTRDYSLRK